MIRVKSVELREIRLPLIHLFETSFGRTDIRRIILLTLRSDDELGYGECTAGEDPLYSEETTETAWHLLCDFIIPSLMDRELERASDAAPVLSPIRGNRMAKATIETALWDLEARQLGVPLSRHIGGVRSQIPCGVSIGIQNSIVELLQKVRGEIADGYRRLKIKIKPGWDLEPLKAIRTEFPHIPLMADANSAFSLSDIQLFRKIDDLELMMIEQPLAHDDMVDHAILQREVRTPICLDESIHSSEDARKAVEMGSCRIINVKLGRVGGFNEAMRLNDYCVRNGVPIWCGGMLESGVGRAHNIALSTLSGFTLPGDVSASKRYYREDTIIPPVTVSSDGIIQVPDAPGIGYELNWKRINEATVRTRVFGARSG
ncbi:MAG TPA: o-succinylbenzoate synthase [Acidobacteriota bacterium]|nr:o-succinylbenzoate synthase [Acidobacteriota bacterium]